jgi:hypothetical protein
MRQVVHVLREQVEQYFDEVTTRDQLLVGAVILRMILVAIERKCL